MNNKFSSQQMKEIENAIKSGDITGGLNQLASSLQQQKRYAEWFEALKMAARHGLGLSIWSQGDDSDLPLETSRQLEDQLVEACKVVGETMIQDGHIREGWMYLRPVGDPIRARQLLLQLPVKDETLDDIIEVAIGHGVHPAWGYKLMLQRMGTCNAITTFDNQMQTAPLSQRQEAAVALVDQLYQELVDGITHSLGSSTKADSTSNASDSSLESEVTEDVRLQVLFDKHPQLCQDGGYHIDPSHLSSVVRIARIVDDPAAQSKAMQLSDYGTKLDGSLQPEGHLPFDPYFEAHRKYFHILLGRDTTEQSIAFFRKQRFAATSEVDKPGYSFGLEEQFEATETLIELLVRSARYDEATNVLMDQLSRSAEHQTSRWSAALFDCCRRSANYEPLREYGLEQQDPLGFTLACVYAKSESKASTSS